MCAKNVQNLVNNIDPLLSDPILGTGLFSASVCRQQHYSKHWYSLP